MQLFFSFFSILFAGCFSLVATPQCLYDLSQDFAYNCTKEYPLVKRDFERSATTDFSLFGYPLTSPIGIPACAIMTSNGIEWASRAGYDILTYKTVRSHQYSGHPLPNMFVLERESVDKKMVTLSREASFDAETMTMANSMGIPSLSLEWVLEDIAKARSSLLPGQVLSVSIIGNTSEERTLEEDFAFLAKAVVEAGAQIVEANLSCPNLHSPLATYKDPKAVAAIAEAIDEVIPNTPLVLKVGIFDSTEQLREVLIAAAVANAKGICGINAIATPIVDHEGNPAFGPTRQVAGVSGEFIRPQALNFVREARAIIEEEQLDLTLLATGGVMKSEQFDLFLEAGADVVLSATGAMWNPDLAIDYHKNHTNK